MASSSEELEIRTSRTRTLSHGSFTTSCDELDDDPGEQRVEDVTLQFFYKPRTLTLLSGIILAMLYFAFVRNADVNQHDNFLHGSLGVFAMFMMISLLICPNGPFVRPHPALWRVVLGASVFYTLCLTYLLFQSYKDIITMLHYLDPELKHAEPDTEVYAEDCSLAVLWSRIDIFVVAHFLGWLVKALMLRNAAILWLLSITWEFTEVNICDGPQEKSVFQDVNVKFQIAFAHLLENFKECWWDSLLLDVVICNGLGIHVGLWLCKKLEMREYRWESIKDIKGTSKKFRRAVLQFTPISWTEVRWFDPKCIKMRYTSLCLLCIIWQISELNTFFLKHIFVLPTGHWLNVGRVVLISLVVMPTLRQFYLYVTDTRCKRVGTQCWMFILITFFEAILCVRHAKELFSLTNIWNIAIWVVFQMVLCFLLIYFLVIWREKRSRSNVDEMDEPTHSSSVEEVTKRHTVSSTYNLRFKEQTSTEYDGDHEEDTFERTTRRRKLKR